MAGGRGIDESTPLLGQSHGAGSVPRTACNIFVSIVGSGVLGLPYAYKASGWAVASAAIILAALLTYYCMLLLIACKDKVQSKGMRAHTYGDLAHLGFGEAGRLLVDVLICVSQTGCCVAYLIFIGHNLASITTGLSLSFPFIIFVLLPCEIALACLRSLEKLGPFSFVADVCNIVAMAVVIKDDFYYIRGFEGVIPYTTWRGIPFAMGVAIYCYEGFGMTVSLEASMKRPRKFPQVLGLSFTVITMVYLAFGSIGYLAFGKDTQDIITLNLPNDWSTFAVKVGLCIGLFFTFPVMMIPVHEIFERKMLLSTWFQKNALPSPRLQGSLLNGIRALAVLATAVIAVLVPGFGIFISLVGGTVCSLLAFVLPPFLHMRICGEATSWLQLSFDVVLIMCGISFAIYSTYSACIQVFLQYS